MVTGVCNIGNKFEFFIRSTFQVGLLGGSKGCITGGKKCFGLIKITFWLKNLRNALQFNKLARCNKITYQVYVSLFINIVLITLLFV